MGHRGTERGLAPWRSDSLDIVTSLRCTAKLRRRLGLGELPEPGPGDAALGDWYAQLLTVDRQPLVLFVSERSLLAVVIRARDLANLPVYFRIALWNRLEAIGIGRDAIEREMDRLQPLHFAKTRNRSVLGSINDFVDQMKARAAHPLGRDWTPGSFERELGEIPCAPLRYLYPVEVARQLLGAGATVLRGPWAGSGPG